MNFRNRECAVVARNRQTQNMVQWRKFWISDIIKGVEFLTSWRNSVSQARICRWNVKILYNFISSRIHSRWCKKKHFQRLKCRYVAFTKEPKQLIFIWHLSLKKEVTVMRFSRLDCGKKKGVYERLTSDFFSALCQCFAKTLHVELIIRISSVAFFNHRFHAWEIKQIHKEMRNRKYRRDRRRRRRRRAKEEEEE
jgi:hypothetical protein